MAKCFYCNDTGSIKSKDIPDQMCPYCEIGQAVTKGYNKAIKIQLGNYEKLKKQLTAAKKAYEQYTTGKGLEYHDIWCSADRRKPMGCAGCSCTIGRKLKSQQAEIERLREILEQARQAIVQECYGRRPEPETEERMLRIVETLKQKGNTNES
jgi:hypothetical protein